MEVRAGARGPSGCWFCGGDMAMLPGLYAHMLNGFLLSVLLIVGLRPIAREVQLLDQPDSRKRHIGEVPLCGGLAVFTAFMLSGIGFGKDYGIPWNWEVGFGILVLLGFADDRWRLSAVFRLTVQTLVAVILIAGVSGAVLVLGRFSDGAIWYLSAPVATIFSILFVVGTVNAVNMLDGLDGVAGASVVAALFWLALIATHVDYGLVALYALVFMAAVLGFLVFNMRHPWRSSASVFLGDAGTLVLGGAIATFVVHLCSGNQGLSFVALAWLVIVPVADTLSLIVRRLAAGRKPVAMVDVARPGRCADAHRPG
jgi:UDP-GlcNAc:undecaprenyl-phosphate/decaprenyl-phosphate GlcNAc-1-phosphate transferase